MKKVERIVLTIITFAAILILAVTYDRNTFGDFTRGENIPYRSTFSKDNKNKFSSKRSLKIESEDFNDAMYLKTIQVKPNTAYKFSVYVKTEEVQREQNDKIAGANISILGTVEKSESIVGTSDWRKINLLYDSKNNTELQIALRLGGHNGYAKGTCYFSDFEVEEAKIPRDSTWNVLALTFTSTDVEVLIDGKLKKVKINMNKNDMQTVEEDLKRYKNSISEISNNKIQVNYDSYIIKTPINKVSYSDENGYYVAPEDIEETLQEYLRAKEYDYIYAIVRITDQNASASVPTLDWIGLGGMDYLGIGYSVIRLPDNRNNYIYKYSKYNTFPEEVFIHEFLHTLERNSKEQGKDIIPLHDYEKYDYEIEEKESLKKWYADYMNKNIKTENGYVGLDEDIYYSKPIKESYFE